MTSRFLLVLLLLAAVLGSAVAPAGAQRLERPSLLALDRAPAGVSGGTLARAGTRLPFGAWGGLQTASTGEQLQVYASRSYPQDPAQLQRWADFVASLVHGPELSDLTMYLAPLDEVQRFCSPDAVACYGDDTLIAPGEDLEDGTSAEAIVTHEYGHHVAASRNDAPWQAVDWGTKRWATYEGVCAKAQAAQLYPGDEGEHYLRNPGEAFAESYRVMNERAAGREETPWQVVDRLLYPDDEALALLRQDVEQPWSASAPTSTTGSLTRARPSRSVTVSTPLDGVLGVTLRAPAKARYSLTLLTPSGVPAGRATTSSGGKVTLRTTVCGARAYRLKVTRTAGTGAYRLAVSKP